MATALTEDFAKTPHRHVLSVTRLIATGGITGAVLFVLCWLGSFVPVSSATHAFISLFTPAEAQSANALAEGTVWSFLFGSLAGGVFAVVYNVCARFGR